VTFEGRGPVFFAATDNGDNSNSESFHALERKAYDGQCIAILKANASAGKVTMTASAAGLASSTVTFEVATPH
jgi:beta-galactosidase